MNLRRVLQTAAVAIGSMAFSIGIQAFAFTQPVGAPPNSDAYAPLHTGPAAQVKDGGLILGRGQPLLSLQTYTGVAIRSGGLLLGNGTVPLPSGNALFSGHVSIGHPSDANTSVEEIIRATSPVAVLDVSAGRSAASRGVHVGNLAPAGLNAGFETNFDGPANSFVANESGTTVFGVIGGGVGYFKGPVQVGGNIGSANSWAQSAPAGSLKVLGTGYGSDFCITGSTKCLSALTGGTPAPSPTTVKPTVTTYGPYFGGSEDWPTNSIGKHDFCALQGFNIDCGNNAYCQPVAEVTKNSSTGVWNVRNHGSKTSAATAVCIDWP